jgi:hypothetical protein
MDGALVHISLFLLATFVAALVAGLAGFAFGLVAAAVWLHILSPLQTATLIVGYGLIVQGYAVRKLRQALSWQRLGCSCLAGCWSSSGCRFCSPAPSSVSGSTARSMRPDFGALSSSYCCYPGSC